MKPTASAAKVQHAIEDFRHKRNGPKRNEEGKLSKHAKRVSIEIHVRNGDGNYHTNYRGHWFCAGMGTDGEIDAAAVRSFLDAIEHKSPVLKSEKTYPRHD